MPCFADYWSPTSNCSPRYYFVVKPKLNWQNSLKACEEKNATLVCIETKEEWESLNDKINTINVQTQWHIGLRKVKNQWEWLNEVSLQWNGRNGDWPWHSSEPSDDHANFAKMYAKTIKPLDVKKYLFDNIVDNGTPWGYICEYPIGKSSYNIFVSIVFISILNF